VYINVLSINVFFSLNFIFVDIVLFFKQFLYYKVCFDSIFIVSCKYTNRSLAKILNPEVQRTN
jgi:hypothetical protein